jgi:hypothetical protein
MQDHTKLDLYNKELSDNQTGTLIGNWYEEKQLREKIQVGRATQQHHITKSRQNLYLSPPEELQVHNPNIYISTAEKILGDR